MVEKKSVEQQLFQTLGAVIYYQFSTWYNQLDCVFVGHVIVALHK